MPVVKPIRFVQIAINADHIIGLTPEGEVYYREKPPYSYTTTSYNHVTGYQQPKKDDDAKLEKKCWKKCYMYELVELPRGGEVREAQSADEGEKQEEAKTEPVIDEPARKVYKDVESVKKVQAALKAKGFYVKTPNDTYKIDGELGNLTTTAIKEFQKSVNLKETGEIDFPLWKALGLLGEKDDNEIVIELDESDITASLGVGLGFVTGEGENEGFYGA